MANALTPMMYVSRPMANALIQMIYVSHPMANALMYHRLPMNIGHFEANKLFCKL